MWLAAGLFCGLLGAVAVSGTQLPNKVSGPIVGYIWSPTDHALRPIQGVLGNATIGDSVVAGFEMMQTLAAVCITWGIFHATLHAHQVIAALILIAAVAMVHHVQQQVEPAGQQAAKNYNYGGMTQ